MTSNVAHYIFAALAVCISLQIVSLLSSAIALVRSITRLIDALTQRTETTSRQ